MNALIIEDEKAALRNLKAIIAETGYEITVVGETDSIWDTVEWLKNHSMPDLVFMDIHLADGSAFEIFHHVDITCPIIFTTAYDEYALRAFKVNSIDYLLKPITTADLIQSLDKLKRLEGKVAAEEPGYLKLIRELQKQESYKTHFLIPAKGDKFIPIAAEDILYFYIADGNVKAVDMNQKEYMFPQTLDELADSLNPHHFFRANRQYILSKKVIKDIDLWFNNRLSVNLKVPVAEKILISKAKVNEFKEWFTGN